jgi:hypothetical protein
MSKPISAFNWMCPYCYRHQVVTEINFSTIQFPLYVGDLDMGPVGVEIEAISCINGKCAKLTLSASLYERVIQASGLLLGSQLATWHLMPKSNSFAQLDFIPKQIRESYYEACRIHDLSPKASATFSRHCLQGMLHDFCGIALDTLDSEITALKADVDLGYTPPGVTPESVEAICRIRSIGKIRACMEQDIDMLFDVDPDEAQALIRLNELLFEEWYGARHLRQQRLAKIVSLERDTKAKMETRTSADD